MIDNAGDVFHLVPVENINNFELFLWIQGSRVPRVLRSPELQRETESRASATVPESQQGIEVK